MSIATATPTLSARQRLDDRVAEEIGDPRPEWVTLAAASRAIGRHVNAVKSIALAGAIRTRIMPGARILYSRTDAERLAAR
jgi:hypothetical protein